MPLYRCPWHEKIIAYSCPLRYLLLETHGENQGWATKICENCCIMQVPHIFLESTSAFNKHKSQVHLKTHGLVLAGSSELCTFLRPNYQKERFLFGKVENEDFFIGKPFFERRWRWHQQEKREPFDIGCRFRIQRCAFKSNMRRVKK